MESLGLLQVLPGLYWVGVALLTVGFVLTLYDRRSGSRPAGPPTCSG